MSVWYRRLCAAGIVLLALSLSAQAKAQTFYSHRIRALGLDFGGIVADPVTDAFLNPARVRDIKGTQLYLAQHDARAITIPYPGALQQFFSDSAILPPESYRVSRFFSVAPVELTIFAPVGKGVLSFSVEIGLNEDESLTENFSQSVFFSRVELVEETRAGRTQNSHVLITGAFGTGASDKTGIGARIILERRKADAGQVNSRDTDRVYDTGDATIDYHFDRAESNFAESRAVVSAGVHRPGGVLRELVVGAGYARREYPIDFLSTVTHDDDADGNGFDPNGGQRSVELSRGSFLSDRVYDGPSFSGRLHADITDNVTITTSAQWTRRSGSGTGRYRVMEEVGPTAALSVLNNVAYEYDGRDRTYRIMAGVGYRNESLARNLLVSLGVFGSFDRENFAEDGVGRLSLMASDQTTIPLVAETDFTQRALRLKDMLRLQFPVAAEWRPLRYLALRLGGVLSGTRVEEETTLRARLTGPELPRTYTRLAVDSDRDISTDVAFTISNGIGVYLGGVDRFSIDLFNRSSGVDLAAYTNLSVRYRF